MSDIKKIEACQVGWEHAGLEVDYYLVAHGAAVNRAVTLVDLKDVKLRDAAHVGEVQHSILFTEIDGIICYAGKTPLQIDGVGFMTRYDDFDYSLPVHYELNPEQPILCTCGGQLTNGEFTLQHEQESDDRREVGYVKCDQCGAKIRAYRILADQSYAPG